MKFKELIPFSNYSKDPLNSRINVAPLNLNISLTIDNQDTEHTYKILSISSSSARINKETFTLINFQNLKNYRLFINDIPLSIDELLKELAYKHTNDIEKISFLKLNNNRYVGDYNFQLDKFFSKNEYNFFLLEECMHNDKFTLPSLEDDKQLILEHVKSIDVDLTNLLLHYAYSKDSPIPNKSLRNHKIK